MKLFFSPSQLAHAPQQFMSAGRIVAPFEVPERAERREPPRVSVRGRTRQGRPRVAERAEVARATLSDATLPEDAGCAERAAQVSGPTQTASAC